MKYLLLIYTLILLIPVAAMAQGTGFNFQGRMNDGTNPANGSYDLQFRLYDSVVGGNPLGPLVSRANTTLINGVFSVTLDFGATAFNNPNNVFIEIGIRPNRSPNAYTILGPRQQLTVVPLAVRAANAANADNATHADTATNATQLGGQPASAYVTRSSGGADFILNLATGIQPNARLSITGDGQINGQFKVGGNAIQNRFKGGFVKAMAFVDANGSIVHCYNGNTDSSQGNCGLTVTKLNHGDYLIDFGFQVSDRFASVTPIMAPLVTIVASVRYGAASENFFEVFTDITDVDHVNSATDNAFMIIVY